MVQNVTGAGTRVTLAASKTFPSGIDISAFAEDADPFSFESTAIAEAVMGANGELITFSKYNPVPVTLSVIPGSEDDQNLAILFDKNRLARGRTPAGDVITLTIAFVDGRTTTLSEGVLIEGDPSDSWQSAGRLKTKAYKFTFGDMTRS